VDLGAEPTAAAPQDRTAVPSLLLSPRRARRRLPVSDQEDRASGSRWNHDEGGLAEMTRDSCGHEGRRKGSAD
jgi:hypothetical protein